MRDTGLGEIKLMGPDNTLMTDSTGILQRQNSLVVDGKMRLSLALPSTLRAA